MDDYVKNLLNEIHVIIHRIDGYLDAKKDFKPRFLVFKNPDKKEQPSENSQKADTFYYNNVTPGGSDTIPHLAEPIQALECKDENKTFADFIKFKKKELEQMPEFRKTYKTTGIKAYIRKTKDGIFEVRYRKNGITAVGRSKDLIIAKEKFKIAFIKAYVQKVGGLFEGTALYKPKKKLFTEEFEKWFYEVKVPLLATKTANNYENIYKNHIKPFLITKHLQDILPADCKRILDAVEKKQLFRTKEDVYILMNQFFRYAVDNKITTDFPMVNLKFQRAERETGTALTKEEEKYLLARIKGYKYEPSILLALYAGLRPCELETAEIVDGFVIAENKKQKRNYKKKKTKRIPVTPMLRPYLHLFEKDFHVTQGNIQRMIYDIFKGEHTLKDLRHTFSTRAQECEVPDRVVDMWMGHSPRGTNAKVYTHFSDEFLLKQAEKVKY